MAKLIDISKVPVPDIVETLEYEVILEKIMADFIKLEPDYGEILDSDPVYKVMQIAAYREMIMRQRVNDSARSVLLPSSKKNDLDNLAAFFNLQRDVIVPGNPNANPPVLPVYETDESLKQKILLAWSSITTAGPKDSWEFHAREASPLIKDATAFRLPLGKTGITLLSHEGDGTVSPELITTVENKVNTESVRPLCSFGVFQSAIINSWQLIAKLTITNELLKTVALQEAIKAAQLYVDKQHRIGATISISALLAALNVEGVEDVELLSPLTNIETDQLSAPYCASIEVTA